MPVEFWWWVDFGQVEIVLGGKWHGWISAGWKTAVTLGGKRRVDFGGWKRAGWISAGWISATTDYYCKI